MASTTTATTATDAAAPAAFTKKTALEPEEVALHRIRITLSSVNVKNLEKVSKDLITAAKDQRLKIKGPVRLPTKHLIVPVRKSPCGNGTATWDHYEMSVHKRVIDLQSPSEVVKQITSISIEPDVDVEVTIAAKKAKKPAAAAGAAASATGAAAAATGAAAAKPAAAKKEKTGVAGAKLVQGRQLPRASRLVKAKKVVAKDAPKKKAAAKKDGAKKDGAKKDGAAKPAAAKKDAAAKPAEKK